MRHRGHIWSVSRQRIESLSPPALIKHRLKVLCLGNAMADISIVHFVILSVALCHRLCLDRLIGRD